MRTRRDGSGYILIMYPRSCIRDLAEIRDTVAERILRGRRTRSLERRAEKEFAGHIIVRRSQNKYERGSVSRV